MKEPPTDRPFRWYAAEKIERLEAEIADLKDDIRIYLSHMSMMADLLTPDQVARCRKLMDQTPRMEFLSNALSIHEENAALRKHLINLGYIITNFNGEIAIAHDPYK